MQDNSRWLAGALVACVAALSACSPASSPSSAKAPDPLPEAGKFEATDFSTEAWIVASVTQTLNGGAPMRLCHVSPAINEDISLVVLVNPDGAKEVGAARVPKDGMSAPLGDVEIKVDAGAPHLIRSTSMRPAALAIWPAGTAALASGSDADTILSEVVRGATVDVKESGASTHRSFPIQGLADAIAKCEALLK